MVLPSSHSTYRFPPQEDIIQPIEFYSSQYYEYQKFYNVCAGVNSSVENEHDKKLESVGLYQSVDVLCEGLTEGLCDQNGSTLYFHENMAKNEDVFKGIYLNDVPIKNTTADTINYPRVFAEIHLGSEIQKPMTTFSSIPFLSFTNSIQTIKLQTRLVGLNQDEARDLRNFEAKIPKDDESASDNKTLNWEGNRGCNYRNFLIDVREDSKAVNAIKSAEKNQIVSIMHHVTNNNVTALSIDFFTNGLLKDQSDWNAVNFVIKTGYVGDEKIIPDGGSVRYLYCSISGKCTTPYYRNYFITLPPPSFQKDRFVKIFRTDEELGPTNVTYRKDLGVDTIGEIVETPLSYPNTMVAGMIFDARAFNNIPKRTFDCKMLKINLPDNYDPITKNYDGNWSGSFSTYKQWSNNPAWILYDILINDRYGAGKFGMKDFFIDKWNLYRLGKYCDELIPTGYTGKFPLSDFTIDSGGVVVTIDDSSTNLGQQVFEERFPAGSIVSIFDTVDENNNQLNTAYRRLIIDTAYSNNAYTFKIIKLFSPEKVFLKYPDLRSEFNRQINLRDDVNSPQNDPYIFLKDLLKNHDSNDLNENTSAVNFINDFIQGEALDFDVSGGKIGVNFAGYLPLLEPLFAFNIYLDQQQNVLNVINDLTAIFRGMIYWSSGSLFITNDQKRDAVMLFTNSNVVDGTFVYTGSADTARSTVATIRYNDETDNYKPRVEYVENAAGLRQYGYKPKDIIAIGVTSRGQAHRIGEWLLYTNQTETDTVQFSTGQEGSYLKPSDVIKIQDKLKNSKRYGGRIVAIDYALHQVTLDQGVQEGIVGQKITFITPKANKTSKTLSEEAKAQISNQNYSGVSDSEIEAIRQPQIKEFTVASVSETNVITISEINDEDFNLIKSGYVWSAQNLNAEYDIKEIEYRVISVNEKSSNEYMVTAMMYNRSKFDAIDLSKSVENTQQSASQIVTIGALPEPLRQINNPISTTFVTFSPNVDVPPYFDGRFPIRDQRLLQKTYKQQYLTVDFSQMAVDNNVSASNTGGYILQVTKSNGDQVRVTLDGYDNTVANIFLGELAQGLTPLEGTNTVTVDIFRYDSSKKLESIGV